MSQTNGNNFKSSTKDSTAKLSNDGLKITSPKDTVNAQTRAAQSNLEQSERRDGPGGN